VGVSLPSAGPFLAGGAPAQLSPGFKLDRYELLCPIAEGGMASIWIARQQGKHGFQKLVAIKTILPKFAAEPKFQHMFVDEARIASRIEHTNVTQILDVGEQAGVTYLVMEYVDGDSLSKVNRAAQKKNKPIPTGVLLRIMADTCAGLHAAHDLHDEAGQPMGVIHRDVSPQNVLVTTKGGAKLIDFGIAKARDRLSGDTKVDQVKGKVAYMAPEQAVGRSLDRRADVWSVGAVLYHLFSGKPPFEGENEIQTLFKLSSGQPPAPLPAHVPAPVAAVVMRALSLSPDARYATAAQLEEALEKAMVEAKLVTTAAQVAVFMGELMGDRAEKRKESIALGLKAADEREKLADVLQRNAETTSAGSDSGVSSRPGATPGARIVTASGVAPESEKSGAGSGQTLGGSAAMAVPTIETGAPVEDVRPARGRKLAVVVGVMAVAAVAAGVAFVAIRTPVQGSAGASVSSSAGAAVLSSAGPAVLSSAGAPPPAVGSGSVAASATAASSSPGKDAAPSAPSASSAVPAWHPATRWVPPPASPPRPTATVKQRDNYGF
jgi:hypothetical protein